MSWSRNSASATVSVRPEWPEDHEAVSQVHAAAFPTTAEAQLVERVRANGCHPVISLVAVEAGEVVGHILLSPVSIGDLGGGDRPFLGLGPMAVIPGRQRRGIGSRLVRAAIEGARALECGAVFVLGHPEYYPFFGFEPAAARGLHFRSAEYDPAFFVLELQSNALRGVEGAVTYDPAFDAV